jgi:hypothetical protein
MFRIQRVVVIVVGQAKVLQACNVPVKTVKIILLLFLLLLLLTLSEG